MTCADLCGLIMKFFLFYLRSGLFVDVQKVGNQEKEGEEGKDQLWFVFSRWGRIGVRVDTVLVLCAVFPFHYLFTLFRFTLFSF